MAASQDKVKSAIDKLSSIKPTGFSDGKVLYDYSGGDEYGNLSSLKKQGSVTQDSKGIHCLDLSRADHRNMAVNMALRGESKTGLSLEILEQKASTRINFTDTQRVTMLDWDSRPGSSPRILDKSLSSSEKQLLVDLESDGQLRSMPTKNGSKIYYATSNELQGTIRDIEKARSGNAVFDLDGTKAQTVQRAPIASKKPPLTDAEIAKLGWEYEPSKKNQSSRFELDRSKIAGLPPEHRAQLKEIFGNENDTAIKIHDKTPLKPEAQKILSEHLRPGIAVKMRWKVDPDSNLQTVDLSSADDKQLKALQPLLRDIADMPGVNATRTHDGVIYQISADSNSRLNTVILEQKSKGMSTTLEQNTRMRGEGGYVNMSILVPDSMVDVTREAAKGVGEAAKSAASKTVSTIDKAFGTSGLSAEDAGKVRAGRAMDITAMIEAGGIFTNKDATVAEKVVSGAGAVAAAAEFGWLGKTAKHLPYIGTGVLAGTTAYQAYGAASQTESKKEAIMAVGEVVNDVGGVIATNMINPLAGSSFIEGTNAIENYNNAVGAEEEMSAAFNGVIDTASSTLPGMISNWAITKATGQDSVGEMKTEIAEIEQELEMQTRGPNINHGLIQQRNPILPPAPHHYKNLHAASNTPDADAGSYRLGKNGIETKYDPSVWEGVVDNAWDKYRTQVLEGGPDGEGIDGGYFEWREDDKLLEVQQYNLLNAGDELEKFKEAYAKWEKDYSEIYKEYRDSSPLMSNQIKIAKDAVKNNPEVESYTGPGLGEVAIVKLKVKGAEEPVLFTTGEVRLFAEGQTVAQVAQARLDTITKGREERATPLSADSKLDMQLANAVVANSRDITRFTYDENGDPQTNKGYTIQEDGTIAFHYNTGEMVGLTIGEAKMIAMGADRRQVVEAKEAEIAGLQSAGIDIVTRPDLAETELDRQEKAFRNETLSGDDIDHVLLANKLRNSREDIVELNTDGDHKESGPYTMLAKGSELQLTVAEARMLIEGADVEQFMLKTLTVSKDDLLAPGDEVILTEEMIAQFENSGQGIVDYNDPSSIENGTEVDELFKERGSDVLTVSVDDLGPDDIMTAEQIAEFSKPIQEIEKVPDYDEQLKIENLASSNSDLAKKENPLKDPEAQAELDKTIEAMKTAGVEGTESESKLYTAQVQSNSLSRMS